MGTPVALNQGSEESGSTRVEAARAKARRAKAALGLAGVFVFAISLALARLHYAGHSKQPARSLSAPPAFVRVVRQSALEAGVLAPAEAPPSVATSPS